MSGVEEPRVRLQVTVDRSVADRITELAIRLERSQSWLTAELLRVTLEDREKVVEWAASRIATALVLPITGRPKPSGEAATIQTFVTSEVATRIEALAAGMNQSVSKAAAWLLEQALDDNAWVIDFVTSWAGRKMMRPILALVDGWKALHGSAGEPADA